jgi:hypothetical protein
MTAPQPEHQEAGESSDGTQNKEKPGRALDAQVL